jgi:hypothetical protein
MPQAESIAPIEHSEIANRGAVLATVCDYDELQRALRDRADELNLSRQEIDRLARLPPGYASKLLAPQPIKKLGNSSLPFLLSALGVHLQLVEDGQSLDEINRKATRRAVRVPVRAYTWGHVWLVSKRWVKLQAKAGGKARAEKMTPAQRRESARHAATIRWRDVKAAAREPNGSSAPRRNGSRRPKPERARARGMSR